MVVSALANTHFCIYAKNWLNDMGVKTGLRPLQGVKKQVLPYLGRGGGGHEKVKNLF